MVLVKFILWFVCYLHGEPKSMVKYKILKSFAWYKEGQIVEANTITYPLPEQWLINLGMLKKLN